MVFGAKRANAMRAISGREMKKKTQDLTGAELDYFVAIASGRKAQMSKIIDSDDYECRVLSSARMFKIFAPHAQWDHGGRIIDIERISIENVGVWRDEADEWRAYLNTGTGEGGGGPADIIEHEAIGPTALIAAMRCFVLSKFGEEVEWPP